MTRRGSSRIADRLPFVRSLRCQALFDAELGEHAGGICLDQERKLDCFRVSLGSLDSYARALDLLQKIGIEPDVLRDIFERIQFERSGRDAFDGEDAVLIERRSASFEFAASRV